MRTTLFLTTVAVILFAGCATVEVHSDWDTGANFSHLKTYGWLSEEQPKTGDARLDNSLLDERVRQAVDQTLNQKGYQRLEGGVPDFWVSYHAAIQGKIDVSTINSPYYAAPVIRADGTITPGWNTWGQEPQTLVSQYDEGTLMLDFADASTKRLIWRGTASSAVEPSLSPEKRKQKIDHAVEKILAKFPPG